MRREWIEIFCDWPWKKVGSSPSMRREWIEISEYLRLRLACNSSPSMRREWIEMFLSRLRSDYYVSPSMRREWIEIPVSSMTLWQVSGLPPCGGSGLKCLAAAHCRICGGSPSMRREWIEMYAGNCNLFKSSPSPSMRREWIEICCGSAMWNFCSSLPPCGGSGLKYVGCNHCCHSHSVSLHAEGVDWNSTYSICFILIFLSPSMRREWIEMLCRPQCYPDPLVSLRVEGVDWNTLRHFSVPLPQRLPPCGGSGLKCLVGGRHQPLLRSPSVWREWIEIRNPYKTCWNPSVSLRVEGVDWNTRLSAGISRMWSLPPCGGSGLKYAGTKAQWNAVGLPPCGGSGLK